jgi:hypothetical protein
MLNYSKKVNDTLLPEISNKKTNSFYYSSVNNKTYKYGRDKSFSSNTNFMGHSHDNHEN